jgi:phosphatidylinositol glycan class B
MSTRSTTVGTSPEIRLDSNHHLYLHPLLCGMPTSPSQSKLLAAAVAVRSLSLLSQTFFQPDEFYQALEPAHRLVFGYGVLTWEWRDLPDVGNDVKVGVLTRLALQYGAGRLRSWLWPSCFAGIYWLLQVVGSDGTFWIVSTGAVDLCLLQERHPTVGTQTLAPRIPLVLMAALTDYYTSLLAARLMGSAAQTTAVRIVRSNNRHRLSV